MDMTDRANGIRRLTLLSIGCLVCLSIGRSTTAHAAQAGVDKLSPAPQPAAKRATPLSPDSINLYLPLIARPGSPEWGVRRVHAPDVWYTYGVRGEGVVVGTADTGVQWDHPALEPHYRGWNGSSAD